MEQTTELRLAWRQEFASALLDEIEENQWSQIIIPFCNSHILRAEYRFNMRNTEMSLMGYIVKRKLSSKGIIALIRYLEMLEDCFTDCKMCLN